METRTGKTRREIKDALKDRERVWIEVGEYLAGKEKIGSIYGMMASCQYDDTDCIKLGSEHTPLYDAMDDTPYFNVLVDIIKVVNMCGADVLADAWIDVYSFMDRYERFNAMGEDEQTLTYKVLFAIVMGYIQILGREE